MVTVFRLLFKNVTTIFVIIVLTCASAYYLAVQSVPEYDRDYALPGVSAPIKITRDHADVPHIFPQNDRDAFYALGFVHAQDRMWQMLIDRRTVQGRLSEVFGPATLASDILMRRLGVYALSERSVQAFSDDIREVLDAYADGVNARLMQITAGGHGRGAPEMWVFNQDIAPWRPADSIALMKLFALKHTGQIDTEVLRANLSAVLSPAQLESLMPRTPDNITAPLPLPGYDTLFPSAALNLGGEMPAPDLLFPVLPRAFTASANVWAAGRDRSTTGGALLANDLHGMLGAPSNWYLARLELQTGGVIGATIPGIPAVFSGRNSHIAWGISNASVDDLDLYVERIDPQNRNRYRNGAGWSNFDTRDSIIEIADAAAVTVKLLATQNGPVLPLDRFGLDTVRPQNAVISVNWTGLSASDTTIEGLIGIMRATSSRQAVTQAAPVVAPAMMLVVADDRTIGSKLIGHVPQRDPRHETRGLMPSAGAQAQNRFLRMTDYADLPEQFNPADGVIGFTNNKVSVAPFPEHITFNPADTQRILRWQRLINLREVHTRDSFIEAQLDTVSATARTLLPLVGADLWFTADPAPEGTVAFKRQQALDLMALWNGEMNEHLPEPLIYAAWMRALQDRLIRDELGPLADRLTRLEPLFIEAVFRDVNGAGQWCDIVQSAAVETCAQIAQQALDDAVLSLEKRYGPAIQSWRWGDAHQASHTHPVAGHHGTLGWLVNIRQSVSGGDHTLARSVSAGTSDNPFETVHSAGYRGVYDLANPDNSVFIISTGQSGNPLSRYYDNLGELWRRGEYIPMSLDPALAEAASVGVMRILPLETDR